jgi:DNA polymerase-3 subunit gamma/tau
LFDQVAAFSEGDITYEKIRDKLGLVGTEMLNALAEKCAAADVGGALEAVQEIFDRGVSAEQFVCNVAEYLRSVLFVKSGVTKEAVLGQGAERFSPAVLSAWSGAAIERGLELFLQLYRDLRYSLNPRSEVDLGVARLCSLATWVSPGELRDAIDRCKAALGGVSTLAVPRAGASGVQSPPSYKEEKVLTAPAAVPGGFQAALKAKLAEQAAAAPAVAASTAPVSAVSAAPAAGLPVQLEIVQRLFKGTIEG